MIKIYEVVMEKNFDIKEYVYSLGTELVFEFSKAKLSTQSVAKGSNKEMSVIRKLTDILPAGVGVGSGFVYDSYGNVSNQCDIIIYEKDFCIKACINGDEKNTYYNCESVIAVGEIKSILYGNELRDSIEKFINLNKLIRFKNESDNGANRQYLSKMGLCQNLDNSPLERTDYDRIYKFILCEKIDTTFDNIFKIIKESVSCKDEIFNTLLDLDGKQILFAKEGKLTLSPQLATTIFMDVNDSKNNFNRFIYHLTHFIKQGTTVPLNYEIYFKMKDDKFTITNSATLS